MVTPFPTLVLSRQLSIFYQRLTENGFVRSTDVKVNPLLVVWSIFNCPNYYNPLIRSACLCGPFSLYKTLYLIHWSFCIKVSGIKSWYRVALFLVLFPYPSLQSGSLSWKVHVLGDKLKLILGSAIYGHADILRSK